MNPTSNVPTKRIHTAMCKERAPKNATYLSKTLFKSHHPPKSRDAEPFKRHSMDPIAARQDPWLPQSELKGHSEAIPPRKARQIRHKSKTHKANRLPS